jgi:hypothetical protein
MYGTDNYDVFGLELCAEVGNVGILQDAGLLLLAQSMDWRRSIDEELRGEFFASLEYKGWHVSMHGTRKR